MKHTTTLAVVLAATLLTSGCGQSSEQARTQIQAAYTTMDQGLQKKDAAAVLSVVAPSYTYQASSGKTYTRDQMESSIKDGFKAGETTSATTVRSCTTHGDEATVAADTEQTSTMADPSSGKRVSVVVRSQSEDRWKHEGASWKLVGSKELSHQTLKDGKAYTPGAASAPGSKASPSTP